MAEQQLTYEQLRERLEKAEADYAKVQEYWAVDRERLEKCEQWIADLQSGMYVNCVYCGHRYGPDSETPVAMAEILKQHVEKCPEHPMSKLRERLEKYEAENKAVRELVLPNDPTEPLDELLKELRSWDAHGEANINTQGKNQRLQERLEKCETALQGILDQMDDCGCDYCNAARAALETK